MSKLAFVTCLCLFAMSVAGYAGWYRQHNLEDCPDHCLDRELLLAITGPNKWNYKVVWPFYTDDYGLTYELGTLIDIPGKKFDNHLDILPLYQEVYEYLLTKLNSLRSIRPFLANFPLDSDSFTLSIGFPNEDGSNCPPPNFASVIQSHDGVEFNFYRKENQLCAFETEKKIRARVQVGARNKY